MGGLPIAERNLTTYDSTIFTLERGAPMATNYVAWRSWFSNPKHVVEFVQIVAALVVLHVYGEALSWRLIALAMFVAFFSQIRSLLEGLTKFCLSGREHRNSLGGPNN
jgi:hypothetical protein